MEQFLLDEQVVRSFAKHVISQEELSKESFYKIMHAKKTFSAIETQDQILYAVADQAYHDLRGSIPSQGLDTSSIYHQIESQYTLFDPIGSTAPQVNLTHLVHYGACYYSYLYCRVIVSNLWTTFFQGNPLNSHAGMLIRDQILSLGGSRDPNILLENVLGKNYLDCSHFLKLD